MARLARWLAEERRLNLPLRRRTQGGAGGVKLLMTADAVGGVWHYATELAGALRPHGVETTIAVLGPSPSEDQRRAVPAGIEVIDTGLPLDWLAEGPAPVHEAAARLAALASEIGADVAHLNSPTLAGAARLPCPVVAVAHGCIGTWWDAAEAAPLPAAFDWQVADDARGARRRRCRGCSHRRFRRHGPAPLRPAPPADRHP